MKRNESTTRQVAAWLLRGLGAPALCLGLGLGGCDPEPAAQDEEIPYGVGGKADGTCPADAPLCWQSDDVEIMKAAMREQDNVLAGRDVKGSLTLMLDYATYLEHKLPDESLDAIADIEADIQVLPEGDIEVPTVTFDEEGTPYYPEGDFLLATQVLYRIHTEVLGDAEAAYFLASAVPLGKAAETQNSKTDETSENAPEELDPKEFGGLSEDMLRSLQLLQDSGFLGQFAVTIYKTTGILEDDYEVVNGQNFGEIGPDGLIRPAGLSREAKVDRIINRYMWSSGLLGAGAGLASAVPIAGTAIGVSAEVVWLFKLHAQMSFEIAAVYGWNIREGDNLLHVTHMMVAEGFAVESADIMLSNVMLPLVAKRLSKRFGFELADDLAKKLASRGLQNLMGFLTKKGQQQLANVALKQGLKGVAKGVLTWATLGAAALVSAGLDAASTLHLGRQVQAYSKAWVGDLMFEGASYLSERRHRDCAFRALASIAWADGDVKSGEQKLFQAYLAKPYAEDEQTWFHLASQERVAQSQMLARWPERDDIGDVHSCLTKEFKNSDSEHRISLLGHVYTMLQVDGNEGGAELDVYEDYRDGLDGSGFFDGSAIDLAQLTYVERAVKVSTNPNIIVDAAADEHIELAEDLLAEETLEFLAETPPEVATDFDCGFNGNC